MNQRNQEKLCKVYLTKVQNTLNTIIPKGQVEQIMYNIKQSVASYFDENPTATFEDFEQHFGTPENIISYYLDESLIDKIDTNIHKKRTFKLIAILAIIFFVLFSLLCINAYIHTQDVTIFFQEDIIY